MTIIRDQNAIPAASTADLIATYNALTGKSIKKFSSRAAGEVQVSNAILAAQDRAGHAGVSKGEMPKPATEAEVKSKSLRAALAEKAGAAEPNKPRDKPAKRETNGKRRGAISAVQLTGGGLFRLQANSMRGQIMAWAEKQPAGKPIEMTTIEAKFGDKARAAVMLLIDREHFTAIRKEAA